MVKTSDHLSEARDNTRLAILNWEPCFMNKVLSGGSSLWCSWLVSAGLEPPREWAALRVTKDLYFQSATTKTELSSNSWGLGGTREPQTSQLFTEMGMWNAGGLLLFGRYCSPCTGDEMESYVLAITACGGVSIMLIWEAGVQQGWVQQGSNALNSYSFSEIDYIFMNKVSSSAFYFGVNNQRSL